MIKIKINNSARKVEYFKEDPEYQDILDKVLEHFDIQGNITCVSYDGNTEYGVYCIGKPTVSPIDLSDIDTDPLTKELLSFKISLADNSIRLKVYYSGNTKGVTLDGVDNIVGTGVYIGENSFTVYYSTDTKEPWTTKSMTASGFSAITFYADGTTSDESVYTQEK